MPLQKLPRRPFLQVIRYNQHLLAVMLIIVLTVTIIIVKVLTDNKVEIRINRDVAAVKQGMNIRSQQQSVCYKMLPSGSIRLNVGRLLYWKRLLSRDRTSPLICIRNRNTESTLTDTMFRCSDDISICCLGRSGPLNSLNNLLI